MTRPRGHSGVHERSSGHVWFPDLTGRPGPIYRAIVVAIAEAIRDGDLLAGDRLPPHRHLASTLDVDLTTATRAYAEAQRQGLVESQVGRGTFVRAEAPLVQSRRRRGPVVDLTMNLPPLPQEPSLPQILLAGLERTLRRQDVAAMMTYHWDTGSPDDRVAAATWLQPCLGPVDPQRVIVCPGAQSAMLAVVSTFAGPGEQVVCEPHTYAGLRALALQFGVTLAPVACDGAGFVPDALDRACHALRPRLIYCNPTIQNPTTVTMPVARRRAVASIARAYGVPILEDDAYGLFPHDKLEAITSIAPDGNFYLATTAKSLTPGLRVAYLVCPDRPSVERLTAAIRGSVQMGSGLLTGLVTQLIRTGEAADLLGAIRLETVERQRIAAVSLRGFDVASHPEGLHVWLSLPRHWRATEFASYARHAGLALVPEAAFRVGIEERPAVRLALGAASSRTELRGALDALCTALGHHDEAGLLPIV